MVVAVEGQQTHLVTPPSDLLRRIANNPSAEDFNKSFEPLRARVCSYLADAGFDFASFDNVLDFTLAGHDCFRVYPTLKVAGLGRVACTVEIRSGEKVLARQEALFNHTRSFGPTHYVPMRLCIPPHRGEVTVNLWARLEKRGTFGEAHLVTDWSFPHFM